MIIRSITAGGGGDKACTNHTWKFFLFSYFCELCNVFLGSVGEVQWLLKKTVQDFLTFKRMQLCSSFQTIRKSKRLNLHLRVYVSVFRSKYSV